MADYSIRSYSGSAQASTLQTNIGAGDTSFSIGSADASTWVDVNNQTLGVVGTFVCVIGYGGSNEEKVLCSGISSNVVTISQRGYDGTTAASHSTGEIVMPVLSANEAYVANLAVNKTIGKVTTVGDMLYADAANSLTRLAVGSSASILGTAGGIPAWNTPTSGASAALQNTTSGLQWISQIPTHGQFDNGAGTAQTISTNATADQQVKLTIASTYTLGINTPTVSSNVVTINRAGLYKITLRTGLQATSISGNALVMPVLVTPDTTGSTTVTHYGSAFTANSAVDTVGTLEVVVPINPSNTAKTITPYISLTTITSGTNNVTVPKSSGKNSLTVTYLGPLT
jgi:hypothetical protein